jgi:hypothetical protein
LSKTVTVDRVRESPGVAKNTPVFRDGFGSRSLTFEFDGGEAGDPIEVLAFDQALVDNADFGATLGSRVARLANARQHTLFARVRRLDRPTPDSLILVSDRVPGWRLADVLDRAHGEKLTIDISAVLSLLRQLIPAVALFARHQKDLAIGAIGPERLILTPQGRLVLAEYVLGDAVDKLGLTRERLWKAYRVPVAAIAGAPPNSPRSDVLGIGIVVLSLLMGRRLRDDEYPDGLGDLLRLSSESSGGNARPLSDGLSDWLGRALQLDEGTAFASPHDAQVGFEEMLASERGYVTSPILLDGFIARFQRLAGPPPQPSKPVARTPLPQPVALHVAEPEPEPEPDPEQEPHIEPEPAPVASVAPIPVYVPPPPPAMAVAPPPVSVTIPASPEPERPRSSERRWAAQRPEPLPVPEPEAPQPSSYRGYGVPTALNEVKAHDYGSTPASDDSEPPMTVAEYLAEPRASARSMPAAVSAPPVADPIVSVGVSDHSADWMKKAVAALAVLCVIEGAAVGWLWIRSSAMLTSQGELVVSSRPASARVTLDDDDLGVTPVTQRLAPGTYTLKVQSGTSEPRVIVVQIRPGVQTAQYLELQTGR